MVRLTSHESLSRETVRRRLAENYIKPWRKSMWCIPKVDAEYVAHMEDVLDLYAEAADPQRPVVCFDESPVQLIGEIRQPIPAKPRRIERYDYEYRRNGTANLFVLIDVNRPWRKVKVTEQRTAKDFAECMRELVDVHYPKAQCIRIVLDNLSTHKAVALYQAFPPDEARRVLRRIEFHHTPKYASWLNMVEIEIGVLSQQCLDRRIDAMPVSSARPPPGKNAATPSVPESIGCSQPRTRGPNSPRRSNGPGQANEKAKSQNLCAEVLVRNVRTWPAMPREKAQAAPTARPKVQMREGRTAP